MIGTAIVFTIVISFIQITASQNIPEECKREPPSFVERPLDCCRIPKIYKEEDVRECAPHLVLGGAQPPPPPPAPALAPAPSPQQGAPPPPRPPHHPALPPCDIHMCVLRKNNLLNADSSLNYEAIARYLDEYAASDAELVGAVGAVKARCMAADELARFGPPHMCDALKLGVCTSAVLFSECPAWETSEGCAQVQQYVDKCKPFMFEKEPTTEGP